MSVPQKISRRALATMTAAAAAATVMPASAAEAAFVALEAKLGARIGVMALDTGSGRRLSNRAHERFAMCSSFKWLLAAAILAEVDRKRLALDQVIPYGKSDLLFTSPVTRANVAKGGLPVVTLCQAVVEVSDNAAANRLLKLIGGPAGFTRFARSIGDNGTRLDRTEPALNENKPGDPRDTTTPAASVATMQKILLGDVLTPSSRQLLVGWMKTCQTGAKRLRAGLPTDWIAGDKTGTSKAGAVNDVAIAWPPGRAPILIACYIDGPIRALDDTEAAHANVARHVVAAFA